MDVTASSVVRIYIYFQTTSVTHLLLTIGRRIGMVGLEEERKSGGGGGHMRGWGVVVESRVQQGYIPQILHDAPILCDSLYRPVQIHLEGNESFDSSLQDVYTTVVNFECHVDLDIFTEETALFMNMHIVIIFYALNNHKNKYRCQ